MKLSKTKFFAFCVLLLAGTTVNAQKQSKSETVQEKGSHMFGLGVGMSMTGLVKELDYDNDTIVYNSKSRPALNFSYDFFAGNKFTIGFQASTQHFAVDVKHWEFEDSRGNIRVMENVSSKMNRIYYGGRMLFHYKNTSRIDLYSGLRLGMIVWTNRMTTSDQDFITAFEEDQIPFKTRPAFGIVAIGSRIKFTPNISANLELNIGAPHVFSFGASYRLGK